MKGKFLLAALLTVLTVMLCASTLVFAADNETAVTTTSTPAFDSSFLIEMGLVFGGIATLGFVIAELLGMYVTKSAQTSIVQTTSTGINAIVAMTSMGVTASQAAAVTEISGVPTQITPPATAPTTPAK
jgi:hypothetical protein